MAGVGPIDRKPAFVPLTAAHPARKAGASAVSSESESQQRANEAERDAAARIVAAERQVRDTQNMAAGEVDRIREEYNRQGELERVRQEASLESEKQRGYQNLRELQKKQAAEIERIKREGEKTIRELDDHFRTGTRNTEIEGARQLREAEVSKQQSFESHENLARFELESAKVDHTQKLQDLHQKNETTLAALTENSRAIIEDTKVRTEEARVSSEEKFRGDFEHALSEQNRLLNQVQSETATRLKQLRADTASKLSAYSDRQHDPFYKLKTLDAQVSDTGDGFLLRARVPLHEQNGISVSIKGNQLVVSGQRRNEEKLELTPGHTQSTASYQSFSESIPVNFPVEARELIRAFDGDELIAWVPKKGMGNTARSPEALLQRPKVAVDLGPARLEQPHFPNNLPVVRHEPSPEERAQARAQERQQSALTAPPGRRRTLPLS